MNKLLLALTCLLLIGSFSHVHAQDINGLRSLNQPPRPPFELKGATVSTEARAKEIAGVEYFKNHGWLAEESSHVTGIVTLGIDLPEFANKGDQIWEVRVMKLLEGELRAVIWVHAKTEKVKFLVAPPFRPAQ